MATTLSVSLFAVNNPRGHELAIVLQERIAAKHAVTLTVHTSSHQSAVNHACLHDDLVIFDASIEEGHNYQAATAQPMALDHVLVISRTYLPLNFYGLREGGAPPYPGSRSNEALVSWVLDNMPKNQRANKGLFKYFGAMSASLDLQYMRRKAEGNIFISYRSMYYPHVYQLKTQIERGDFHKGVAKSVFLVAPEALTYKDEIFTEQRYWQLVSIIERRIAVAEELWIYNTNDYLDSWWTRAEIVAIAYQRASGARRIPRIRLFDPGTGILTDAPDHYIPAMTSEEMKRMTRWFSNADPATMGPEAVQAMQLYARLPLAGQLKYFQDHVWKDSFWEHYLLPCSRCRQGKKKPSVHDLKAFLWIGRPDAAGSDLGQGEPGLVDLSPIQLAEGISRGLIHCPSCGSAYTLREDPYPRYIWMATRMGVPTGPGGTNVLRMPVYRVAKAE